MATVRKNIIIQGASGMLGDQLVVKRDKAGRTILSVMPTFNEDRTFSVAQKAQQEQFKEAVAYAQTAKTEAVYAARAEGTPQSAYNVAVADWLHAPEVAEIDLSAWTGQAGQTIRIKAVDDVQVKQMAVVITDEHDVVLEQGQAIAVDGMWWVYTTTAAASGQPKVIASAEDLPGHIAQAIKQK